MIDELKEPDNEYDDKAIDGMKELLSREQEDLSKVLEEER